MTWPLALVPRAQPSRALTWLSPVAAAVLTLAAGALLFALMGQDPAQGLRVFLVEPLATQRGWSELALKATPLILCALGLTLCFRANVWNIGAEGQLIAGAIVGGSVALLATSATSRAIVPAILLAAALGGAAWAAVTAWLRDRFNANEILVSLMLVYVAQLLLSWLVHGALRDPQGFGFPQSKLFESVARMPIVLAGTRLHIGFPLALALTAAAWWLLARSLIGFQLKVAGLAPLAARYAGFSSRRVLWFVLLASGALAGVAGGLEADRARRPAHADDFAGLRLRGDHRRVRRAAASGRRRGRLAADGALLHRRRTRAVAPRPAVGADRRVPGAAAVLPADVRHLHRVPAAVAPHGEGDGSLMESFVALVATTMNAGTPLLLAALGIVISERSGVVNLGIEGMMLVAAVLGFTVVHWTGSYGLGFVAGALAGAALAVLFGAMTLGLLTNQFATGLALALFGAGLSAFIGQPLQGVTLPVREHDGIPLLQDIPVLGPALFGHHWLVYGALALAGAVTWFLFRTRGGLVLRAVGESPESAHALGYPVRRIRFAALAFGGACAGLAGAYLSTVYTPLWSEGMVAGRGWIALALVTFATWRPGRVLLGAYLFGGVTMLQFHLQGLGIEVATQLLAMTPYLATIVVLALISRNPRWIRLNMPASLGKPFNPNA